MLKGTILYLQKVSDCLYVLTHEGPVIPPSASALWCPEGPGLDLGLRQVDAGSSPVRGLTQAQRGSL